MALGIDPAMYQQLQQAIPNQIAAYDNDPSSTDHDAQIAQLKGYGAALGPYVAPVAMPVATPSAPTQDATPAPTGGLFGTLDPTQAQPLPSNADILANFNQYGDPIQPHTDPVHAGNGIAVGTDGLPINLAGAHAMATGGKDPSQYADEDFALTVPPDPFAHIGTGNMP